MSSSTETQNQSLNIASKAELSTMSTIIKEKGSDGWETLWQEHITPWNQGEPSPALVELLEKFEIPQNGIAVVPGCGTAYDLIALASPTRKAYGIDISETAVATAKKAIEGTENAEVLLHDFFTVSRFDDLVDVLFDYTFLCALPPSMRNQWAEKVAKMVKQEGILITLMFPLIPLEGGPPFSLTVQNYHDLLEPYGFKMIYHEKNPKSFEKRRGKEEMAVWKRS